MHWWYYPAEVTPPAGTTSSAPASSVWTLPQCHLEEIRIQIPPGHNGRTGLRIRYMGTQIVPWVAGYWLIGNGDTFTIPWKGEIMPRGVAIESYNIDSVAHTFRLYATLLPSVEPDMESQAPGRRLTPQRAPAHRQIRGLTSTLAGV